jgi:hypothetical protein
MSAGRVALAVIDDQEGARQDLAEHGEAITGRSASEVPGPQRSMITARYAAMRWHHLRISASAVSRYPPSGDLCRAEDPRSRASQSGHS